MHSNRERTRKDTDTSNHWININIKLYQSINLTHLQVISSTDKSHNHSTFGSSGTAAGCLSWEVWWLLTGSTGLAILLSARSCRRLLWERWLHPLHLLGPVLLGCCRLQLTSLSSMIVLQHPLLCEGWGGHPLCLSGNISVLMDLHWPCNCTTQNSILSISSVSVVRLWGIFLDDLGQYSSSFPLFHSGKVFHKLVCPLTIVLSQIFYHLTPAVGSWGRRNQSPIWWEHRA